MNKITQKSLTGTGLAALTFLLTAQTAAAGQCYTMPSCETMGYTETTCVDRTAIKCPFDTSKMKCVTLANTTGTCPEGYVKDNAGNCVYTVTLQYKSGTPAVVGIKYGKKVYQYREFTSVPQGGPEAVCSPADGFEWHLATLEELKLPISVMVEMQGLANMLGGRLFESTNYITSTRCGQNQRSYMMKVLKGGSFGYEPCGGGSGDWGLVCVADL